MAKIKIHAGDFGSNKISYTRSRWTTFDLVLPSDKHKILGETIKLDQLETVEIASEESVKKAGGTIGWGAAGAVLLGPVGLLAGLLMGGKKKEVTFIATFKDGRKMLATTDSKTFTQLQAAVF